MVEPGEDYNEPAAVVANELDPASLPKPLAVLRYTSPEDPEHGQCVYYILGTAHVSKESCKDTATLIRTVNPDVVFVELCAERQAVLHVEKIKEPSLSEVLVSIQSGQVTPFQAIYGWLLARIGNDLDVLPGEEFRIAVHEAHAVGANVVLGDRPVSITLSRLWAALSLWEKWRLIGGLLWQGLSLIDRDEMRQEIEKMKESDVLTEAIKEVGREFPSLLGPLLTERDQFMTFMLKRLGRQAHTVVGVVGAGHLEGIRKHWELDIDIESICRVLPPRRRLRTGRLLMFASVTGVVMWYGIARWKRYR